MDKLIRSIKDSISRLSSDSRKYKYYKIVRANQKGKRATYEVQLLDKKGTVLSASGGYSKEELEEISNLDILREWQQ